MKCESCGIPIPEQPEGASYDMRLCDRCYKRQIDLPDRIKVVKGTQKNSCTQGIHLWKPSQDEIENALEDADNKGFSQVFVHVKKPKLCPKKRR